MILFGRHPRERFFVQKDFHIDFRKLRKMFEKEFKVQIIAYRVKFLSPTHANIFLSLHYHVNNKIYIFSGIRSRLQYCGSR